MAQQKKETHAMRATLSVTLIVFVSKAVGFLRDIVQAHYFGTTLESDIYNNAYQLYYMPILLLTSCITSTMIPLYLDADKQGGHKLANRFASNSMTLFGLVALVLTALMYPLAGPIVRLCYGGLPPEAAQAVVEMTHIMLPGLVFVTISIVQASIMNAREKYIAGQLSGFPYSIVTMIAAWLFSAPYGIRAIAWATTIAGVLQMLIVIPFQKNTFKYEPGLNLRDERIKRMMLLAAPSMVSMAVNEVNHFIDRSFASGMGAGNVTALSLSYRLITFVLGVVIVPITTVMYSRMSKKAAEKDMRSVADILMQCIEVICMVLLPVTVLGIVFSLDAIKLVFVSGKFTIDSAMNTAWLLSMYLLGLVFYGLRDMFNRGFHSLRNTRIPLYTSMLTVVLNIAMKALFSRYLGAGGLALATSVASLVGAFALFVMLKRHLKEIRVRTTLIEVGKILLASAVAMALGMELNRLVPEAASRMQQLLRLIICVGPCMIAYAVALVLMKARQLSFVKTLIRR